MTVQVSSFTALSHFCVSYSSASCLLMPALQIPQVTATNTGTSAVFSNRMPSRFRSLIPSQQFPAEKGRYVLYVNFCCPWAHRTIIALGLKGLGDIIQLVEADARDPTHGWVFSGRRGPDRDPIYGVKYIKELYLKADPKYNGRVTVPMLWDKKTGRLRYTGVPFVILHFAPV